MKNEKTIKTFYFLLTATQCSINNFTGPGGFDADVSICIHVHILYLISPY